MKNSAIRKRGGFNHFLGSLLLVFACFAAGPTPVQAGQDSSRSLTFLIQEEKSKNDEKTLLDKLISVDLDNVTLKKALQIVARKVHLKLVYSPELVPVGKRVTMHRDKIKVEKALWLLLADTGLGFAISSKNHLVLIKLKETKKAEQPVQTGSITGTVVDAETGEVMPGASVFIEGTTMGDATDENGEYSITGIEPGTYTLVARFIGYKETKKEVTVAADEVITVDFELIPQGTILDEIVVTGYQALPAERVTGSFNVVTAEQLDNPTTNIATRLIGTTAGVQADLDVNGNPTFTIRGLTSLYGNETPLIVVDGFPIQGGFDSINPDNVESITILKDAAAASIWGARAANGVIVIKTKSAERGDPLKVSVSSFVRIGNKFDLNYVRALASPAATIEYEKLLFNHGWSPLTNTGSIDNAQWAYSPASTVISEYQLGIISESEMNQRLEQLKLQDNSGQIYDHLLANPVNKQLNIRISGGTNRMTNNLSLLLTRNQSNFQETSNAKYQINYQTEAHVFRWMDFNLSAMLQYRKFNRDGVSLSDIQGMAPYEMLVNPDGSYTNIKQYYWPVLERVVPMQKFPYADWSYNPIQEIHSRNRITTGYNARVQAGFSFDILEGLVFDTKIQYQNFNSSARNLYMEDSYYVRSTVNHAAYWNQTTDELTQNLPTGSILEQSGSNTEAYDWRNQIAFNRRFLANHQISFVAGSEMIEILTKGHDSPITYGYNDERLTVGSFPNGTTNIRNWLGNSQSFSYTNSYSYRTERYFSVYSNLAYTYNDKYTLSGSFRVDASNMITDDPTYRYAPFWSAGVGWQISKEGFMQDISWLDHLNLRLTYGFNGNVDRSTAFRPLISYSNTAGSFFYDPIVGDVFASVSSYGNPTLRWERTGTVNFGVDFSLFEGKLYGKVDLYRKYGQDLIAEISIPAVNGTTSQKLNNAEMLNRGIEVELGTTANFFGGDVVWNGNVAFSYNYNKITELYIAQYRSYQLYGGTYVEGKNANSLWVFEYLGVTDNQPHVQGPDGPVDFSGFVPGDGTTYMMNPGTLVAPYTLGFVNNFYIGNFNLSFILTGQFGHVFKRQPFNYPPKWTGRILPNSSLSEVLNGDPDEVVPMPLNDPESRFYFWDRFHPYMDYLVESASHIRMQEINVAYNLPPELLSKFNYAGNLRVYVQANDLFTILWNDYGEDPEYPKGTMKPQPKFTFGVRLTF